MNDEQNQNQPGRKRGRIIAVVILALVVVIGIVLWRSNTGKDAGDSKTNTAADESSTKAATDTKAGANAPGTDGVSAADDDTDDEAYEALVDQYVNIWVEADGQSANEKGYHPYAYITNDVDDPDEADRDHSTDEELPESYDLRDYGYVTPVKNQSPWGTCWAFADTAASEVSILSAMGKTYEETGLDLSERLLAWFSYEPIPETGGEHAGQGTHYSTDLVAQNARLDRGGWGRNAIVMYSSGVGPVSESVVPYRNEEGTIDCYIWLDEDDTDKYLNVGLTQDKIDELLDAGATLQTEAYSKTIDTLNDDATEVESSEPATWTVDDSYWGESEYVLSESNMLPEFRVTDTEGNYLYTDEDALAAAKRELYAGRAISVSIKADVSRPKDEANHYYYDEEHDAMYHNEVIECDHQVTIVGWDDNFPKEYFGNGDASLQPDRDGAWIIKNSWGAETEEFPNYSQYGVKNEDGETTGYLYVSYWDQCIDGPQTYTFDLDAISNSDATIYQYTSIVSDLTPAVVTSEEPTAEANVYVAEEDSTLYALSVETTHVDTEVTYRVYLVDESCANPMDGELVLDTSETYEFGGYHRIELDEDQQIDLEEGQGYAIVISQYCPDNGLYYQNVTRNIRGNQTDEEEDERVEGILNEAIQSYYQSSYAAFYDQYIESGCSDEEAEEKADAAAWAYIDSDDIKDELALLMVQNSNPENYIVFDATVHEGESYLYTGDLDANDGDWVDWSDVVTYIEQGAAEEGYTFDYDNFSIKAYALADAS